MQISRHWRLQAQRYRLEGVRYEDTGELSLQARPLLAKQIIEEVAKGSEIPVGPEKEVRIERVA